MRLYTGVILFEERHLNNEIEGFAAKQPIFLRFAVIPPDMHHQKTLQFLQILQIGLVTIKVKRDRRATLAIPYGHDVTESGGTAGKTS